MSDLFEKALSARAAELAQQQASSDERAAKARLERDQTMTAALKRVFGDDAEILLRDGSLEDGRLLYAGFVLWPIEANYRLRAVRMYTRLEGEVDSDDNPITISWDFDIENLADFGRAKADIDQQVKDYWALKALKAATPPETVAAAPAVYVGFRLPFPELVAAANKAHAEGYTEVVGVFGETVEAYAGIILRKPNN